jgi:hypothetical protein
MEPSYEIIQTPLQDAFQLQLLIQSYYDTVLVLYGNIPQMREYREFFNLQIKK